MSAATPVRDQFREQMELYVEAAFTLRDILEFVDDPDTPSRTPPSRDFVYQPLVSTADGLRIAANRIERLQEARRRALGILEQLGL